MCEIVLSRKENTHVVKCAHKMHSCFFLCSVGMQEVFCKPNHIYSTIKFARRIPATGTDYKNSCNLSHNFMQSKNLYSETFLNRILDLAGLPLRFKGQSDVLTIAHYPDTSHLLLSLRGK